MESPNSISNQPLRLQVNEKPTFFNKEALLGAAIGIVTPLPLAGTIGAIIGGFIGKNRMQHELDHGKEINEPTLFNKGLILGALAVPALMGIAGTAAVLLIGAAETTALISGIAAPLGLAMLASIPIGAAIGAFSGKSEMAKEKSQAIHQLQNFAMNQHYSKTQEPEVSQDVGTPSRKYTQMIDEQRAQALAAEHTR